MKIIYNIPNIIRMAGMERILAIKANYLGRIDRNGSCDYNL